MGGRGPVVVRQSTIGGRVPVIDRLETIGGRVSVVDRRITMGGRVSVVARRVTMRALVYYKGACLSVHCRVWCTFNSLVGTGCHSMPEV